MQLSDSINPEQSENFALAVRITPDEFTYCIYDADSKEICQYKKILFSPDTDELDDIQQIIFDSDFLTYPYANTKVTYVSKYYDLVPQYLIQKDKKKALYNFTHSDKEKQILYSPHTIQQIATVFNTDEEVYKFLSRNLHAPQFYHHSNIMMQYLYDKNQELPKSSKMYLNFHDDFVDVFCYNESDQILHALTFEAQAERSMVYFILNIWDKCNFDQNTTPLYIIDGYGIPNMYITSKLREYVKEIVNIPLSKNLNLIKIKDELGEPLPLDLLISATI